MTKLECITILSIILGLIISPSVSTFAQTDNIPSWIKKMHSGGPMV